MHPQIVRAEPGSCPICGMALEPLVPAVEDHANPELRDMARRFRVGIALSLPLLALAMADHFAEPTLDALITSRKVAWIQLILATPAVLWGGWPFFWSGWASLVNRRLNMFTLIALGTGVAYFYSLVAALAPGSSLDPSARPKEKSRSISRRPRSSSPWCCSARSSNCARDRRPAAPSARCSISRRNTPALSVTTAPRRTSRSKRSWRATSCGSVPARRCRSMVSCSTGTAPSMSR